MGKSWSAAPPKPAIVPAFRVVKLDGTVKRKILRVLPDGGREEIEVEEDAGYMAVMSKGHSIHLRTLDDLEFLNMGPDEGVPLVDMQNIDHDDDIGVIPNMISTVKLKKQD